jgi:MFS transporter, putative metabolite:H+ symporter
VSRRSQVIDRPGLFACGLVPALLTLLIGAWVPESPRWLVRMGRPGEARRSLAWALQVSPASPPLPKLNEAATRQTAWSDLFRYPRSLLVSWLSNPGMQTTGYGVILWAPTPFVMLLGVSLPICSYL